MDPKIHRFRTTGEAYDASQCEDDIRDGDVLVAAQERVVGILVRAWPTAVKGGPGAFHTLAVGLTWETFEGGKYAASAALATATDPGGRS